MSKLLLILDLALLLAYWVYAVVMVAKEIEL